jgi:hypothetical protein
MFVISIMEVSSQVIGALQKEKYSQTIFQNSQMSITTCCKKKLPVAWASGILRRPNHCDGSSMNLCRPHALQNETFLPLEFGCLFCCVNQFLS